MSPKPVSYGVYARYSSEMQNEISIEGQINVRKHEMANRRGRFVKAFNDSARSGWNLDWDGFKERCIWERMYKPDWSACDHHQVAIMRLLHRKEYGLKL